MSNNRDLLDEIHRMAREQGPYPADAYLFLFQALDRTIDALGEERHVSGEELMEGVRRLAIDLFGPLTLMVFNHWNVRATDDFGRMVFRLVDRGLLRKTDSDRYEDFVGVYDMQEAFAPDALVAAVDTRQLKPTFRPEWRTPSGARPSVAQG